MNFTYCGTDEVSNKFCIMQAVLERGRLVDSPTLSTPPHFRTLAQNQMNKQLRVFVLPRPFLVLFSRFTATYECLIFTRKSVFHSFCDICFISEIEKA